MFLKIAWVLCSRAPPALGPAGLSEFVSMLWKAQFITTLKTNIYTGDLRPFFVGKTMELASPFIVFRVGSISRPAVLFSTVLCISLKCVLSYLLGNEAKSNVVLLSHI